MSFSPRVLPILGCLVLWGCAADAQAELRLSIHILSGQTYLQNVGTEAEQLVAYTLTSPSGSMFTPNWLPITDRLDLDGNGTFDSNSPWVILAPMEPLPTATELTEGALWGGGGLLSSGERIYFGNLWDPNGTLDLSLSVVDSDLNFREVDVFYLPAGDFNLDGTVDAADYTLWRNSLGATGPGLLADANGDEMVDQEDYLLWKSSFGTSHFMAPAAGVLQLALAHSVPEPKSLLLALAGGALWLARLRDRRTI